MKIVRARQVELRTAWKREDHDFTPWLAENLEFLEDVGLGDLELLDTEVTVPSVGRRLDILAVTSDDRKVAIENQYRSVDHDHLTRGLAYAVGLDVDALVVVAEGHGDEFVAVADYLNHCAESTGEAGISIFLVSLSVEQLGEYLVPRFEVVARPNSWRADVKRNSNPAYTAATDHRKAERRRFWTEFLDEANTDEHSIWSNINPVVGGYLTKQALTGVNVTWNISLYAESSNPMLWLDAGDSEMNAEMLYMIRDRVEAEGQELLVSWTVKDGVRACSVDAAPVDDCGWKTPPETRKANLPLLVKLFDEFHERLKPHVEAVYEQLTSRS